MLFRPLAKVRLLWSALFCVFLVTVFCPGVALADGVAERTNAQVYTIINTVRLENRSAKPIYNINLRVPLSGIDNIEWQDVLGEEFSPEPARITVDRDGRRVAYYSIAELKAGDTLNLVQRVAVRNFCITYDVSAIDTADMPADVAVYLEPTDDINSDSYDIRNFAARNTAATDNAYLKARLLFATVNNYLTYDNNPRESHSALTAYNTRSGNCEDYSNLYAAALRSVGIPARVVNGYLYGREAQTDSSYVSPSGHINADKMRHSWVMFYISGAGWLVADPTFSYIADENGENIVDWSRFARITAANRLVYTGEYLPDNNRISYDYQGAAPIISYNSELALYSLISPFRDIVNHWAAESVLGLYYYQPPLVNGIAENYFGVNDYLTRAELAAILNRVLDRVKPLDADNLEPIFYTDLPRSHWAYGELTKAVARGILNGYPDMTVHPDDKISRAEAAVMLNRVMGKIPDDSAVPYNDISAENYPWAFSSVAGLYHCGIMRGVTETSFAPAKWMTRGEGAAVVYRWLKSPLYRSSYVD